MPLEAVHVEIAQAMRVGVFLEVENCERMHFYCETIIFGSRWGNNTKQFHLQRCCNTNFIKITFELRNFMAFSFLVGGPGHMMDA